MIDDIRKSAPRPDDDDDDDDDCLCKMNPNSDARFIWVGGRNRPDGSDMRRGDPYRAMIVFATENVTDPQQHFFQKVSRPVPPFYLPRVLTTLTREGVADQQPDKYGFRFGPFRRRHRLRRPRRRRRLVADYR